MSRKTFFTAALTLTLVVTAGCTDSNATKQQPKVSADQAQAAPIVEPVTASFSYYGKYMPLSDNPKRLRLEAIRHTIWPRSLPDKPSSLRRTICMSNRSTIRTLNKRAIQPLTVIFTATAKGRTITRCCIQSIGRLV
ncbi:hypothetical protein Exig_1534 [Exiguobacterium sibiricum 255-15]|uniref:Uncharacterized protein n=1 Tax=Exiguobacterium sibiricum (strain DSM 17290 / CCUG 55495 / CIP 109462 / JCM 13490 / 255-15) TaxID=262543 RepID=B1YGI7_EXIS2|nr:hypothetical protein Exig_1534 [Exiguobacterium sibiricum 255-15]